MSERFAEPPEDAWTELGRAEYDELWATFNARFGFRQGVSPEAWPAIKEPTPSVPRLRKVVDRAATMTRAKVA